MMAQDFSSRDAKQLISRLSELQNQQRGLQGLPEQYRQDADRLTRNMLSYNAFGTLVRDEVLHNKNSINSVRDADKLMADVSRFEKLSPMADYAKQNAAPFEADAQRLQQSLSAVSGGLRRLFASSQKKQEGQEAYRQAEALLGSEYAKNIASMHAQAQQIQQQPAAAAWQEYTQNPAAFGKALRQMLPELERGGSGVKELGEVVSRHNALLQPFQNAETALKQDKKNIENAANRVAARETLRIMQGVPVEEINRDKGGIRVKTLRDSGFETVADLYSATPQQLSAVKGISDEGAKEIKQIAADYMRESAHSVKIKLSADDKNEEATALVQAIAAYLRRSDSLSDYRKMRSSFAKRTDSAEKALNSVGNGAYWMFYTPAQKGEVVQGYQYLSRLLQSDYAAALQQLSAKVRGNVSITPQQAWSAFEQDTVRFFNVLEDICPDMLGTDNAVYGLPEDLAHAIQQQPLHLDGLKCTLRRYQEWGVKYALNRRRVLLGDEMGLGKTVQAIAAMVSQRNDGATHFVVVCPASVLSNWCREIAKHSDLSVVMVHGASRAASLAQWIKNGGVAVTTYETTGAFALEDDFKFHFMVVDEAHYIKNPSAQRTVNVRKLCEKAENILFMTGTAIENKVDEMIALIEVLQPDVAAQIKRMAFMSSAPQFRESVSPVYYRRRREDVLTELPEKVESAEWCVLSGEEERVYEQAVLSQKYADARRVSWSVDDLSKSSKANRMKELLEEAQNEGRKVLIFSFFLDTIRKISEMLGERCIGPINGSVSPQRRQELVDEFDKAAPGAVLAAQIQSGGTGLNIQSASVVILCEPQFKPSIENQAISRAYRMGQARNVLVYRLLCDDTVDEKIMDMLAQKQAVFDAFADKSNIAEETLELDEKSFGEIMQSEVERIQEKNAGTERALNG